MGTFDDIRPLTPTPSTIPIDQRRQHRKPQDKKPKSQPRRQPTNRPKDDDNAPPHVDEYA